MKELREKSKIEYLGKFAGGPAAAASAAAASVPALAADPASPAASGLDADAISKGMGIK
jgi:hypothetical protein